MIPSSTGVSPVSTPGILPVHTRKQRTAETAVVLMGKMPMLRVEVRR